MNIKEIRANARISFKQITKSGDVFYTFEYGQTRELLPTDDINVANEEIWNAVNMEVNNQIIETKKLYSQQP